MDKEVYYSNCFIEAIKIKWHNPKMKIHVGYEWGWRPFLGFHAWWSDGKYSYQFFAVNEVNWFNYFWHKGYITRRLNVKKQFKQLF